MGLSITWDLVTNANLRPISEPATLGCHRLSVACQGLQVNLMHSQVREPVVGSRDSKDALILDVPYLSTSGLLAFPEQVQELGDDILARNAGI
jgi:hypothetical protein